MLCYCDSQWGLVRSSLSQMLQSWQLCDLLDWWGTACRRSNHQLPTQIVSQELHKHTHSIDNSQMEAGLVQMTATDCCELAPSPAGSGSPHRGHCWRTECFSTSLFSGTTGRSHRPSESQTDTPQLGGDAPSHLTEEEQRNNEEEMHDAHLSLDTVLSV